MTSARLDVHLPDETWLADVTRTYPSAVVRIRGVVRGEDTAHSLVSVVAPDPDPVAEGVAAHGEVTATDTVETDEHGVTLRVTGASPAFVSPARRAGLPLEWPVDASDGTATLQITADPERFTEFGRQLSAAGMTVDPQCVDDHEREPRVLTDTQRALVLDAVERGYYDTPRACTLTELADANGIAKSTCSETLHRAEGRVMKRLAARISVADDQGEEDGSTERVVQASV
ncbi:MAG: helix-turn-helix domain-containing protein [Halorubrum sp.]